MIKVLIVEDEQYIRKGLIYSLDWSSFGCIVIGEAEDGVEGLELIEKLSPDIVISDIRMPQMDGLTMIELALKNNHFSSIILTGYSEFEDAKQAITLKVYDYLLKPIDEEKLVEVLTSLCRRIRLLQSEVVDEKYNIDLVNDISVQYSSRGNLNPYVDETLNIISTSYQNDLSINKIAQKLNVSNSFLSNKFKIQMGCTFVDYLNRYRINHAIKLLREGKMLISEVASAVGFGQYKNFNKAFRKHIGMSTSDFLKSSKNLPK